MTDSAPEFAKSGPEVCLACGYSLRELNVAVCPECGDEALARWEGCRAEREALLGWYRAEGAAQRWLLFGVVGIYAIVAAAASSWVEGLAVAFVVFCVVLPVVVLVTDAMGWVVSWLHPRWQRVVVRACWRRGLWIASLVWMLAPLAAVGGVWGSGTAWLLQWSLIGATGIGGSVWWSSRLEESGVEPGPAARIGSAVLLFGVMACNAAAGLLVTGVLLELLM